MADQRVQRGNHTPMLMGILTGRDGRTFVVAARPTFELIVTNDLGDRSNFDATPVALDGRLYIRSDKALYGIGRK